MRKLLALLLSLSFVLLLFGCSRLPEKPSFEEAATMTVDKPTTTAPVKEEDKIMNVAAVKNTAIGMAYFLNNIDEKKSVGDYTYELLDDASSIGEGLVSGKYDVASVSLLDALNIYKANKGKVQLVAVTSYSNLYLVEQGEVSVSAKDFMNFTGKFYCGSDSISAAVMNYIFKANKLSVTANTEFTDEALASLVSKGRVFHGVLPEPLASVSTMNSSGAENVGLDISDLWEAAVKGTDFEDSKVCSTVLIANADYVAAHPRAVSTFIKEYKASSKNVSSQTTAPALATKYGFFANEETAKAAIPGLSLVCKSGDDAKTLLTSFLGALNSYDASSIPVLPEDDFYYIGE